MLGSGVVLGLALSVGQASAALDFFYGGLQHASRLKGVSAGLLETVLA
ncbi:hypothetical protein [Nonomuraea fuscirosea]